MQEGCRQDGRRQGRMRVVLAEKPSVARELASFLGATQRHDGYYEGGGYQVTWALGHLVTLVARPQTADPADRHTGPP
jgi:DNA topoisomerase-3